MLLAIFRPFIFGADLFLFLRGHLNVMLKAYFAEYFPHLFFLEVRYLRCRSGMSISIRLTIRMGMNKNILSSAGIVACQGKFWEDADDQSGHHQTVSFSLSIQNMKYGHTKTHQPRLKYKLEIKWEHLRKMTLLLLSRKSI